MYIFMLKQYEEDVDNTFSESHLSMCTLHHFSQLKCVNLDAFIIEHDPSIKSKIDLPQKNWTLVEAECGLRNKILKAFEVRILPNIVDGNLTHDLSTHGDNKFTNNDPANIIFVSLSRNKVIMPSALLWDSEWVKGVVELFHLENVNVLVSDRDYKKADDLVRLLCQCMKRHLKN